VAFAVDICSQGNPSVLKELKTKASEKKQSLYQYLSSLSLNELKVLRKEAITKKRSILNPATHLYLFKQNNVAAKLIGVFANHASNHGIVQHTKIGFNENLNFSLGGQSNLFSLSEIKDGGSGGYTSYISKNNSYFTSASVDAVKEPVLSLLNINLFTADAAITASRTGYKVKNIGWFLSHPLIKEIVSAYERSNLNLSKEQFIINYLVKNYSVSAKDLIQSASVANKYPIDMSEVVSDIVGYRSNPDIFRNRATEIGATFLQMIRRGEIASTLVAATRAHTTNGAIASDIAETQIKLLNIQRFIRANSLTNTDEKDLVNGDILSVIPYSENKDFIRDSVMGSKLPFTQLYTTLGLDYSEYLISQYFPHYGELYKEAITRIEDSMAGYKMNVATLRKAHKAFGIYLATRHKFFYDSMFGSSSEQLAHFIYSFPQEYKNFLSKKENRYLPSAFSVLKRIEVVSDSKFGSSILAVKRIGNLTFEQLNIFKREFKMMYNGKAELRDLVNKLFLYCFYRNGFSFGPNSFITLFPTEIKLQIPDYVEGLRDLVEPGKVSLTASDMNTFVEQFIRHEMDNKSITPELEPDTRIKVTDEAGNLLPIVSIPKSIFSRVEVLPDNKLVKE